jgi:hypothetical protein
MELPPVNINAASATMISAGADIDNLRKHLEGLPQELYDQIFELTLECDRNLDLDLESTATWVVNVDKTYKPPVQLQLCRQIRKRVSEAHYNLTTFSFFDPHERFGCAFVSQHRTMRHWLRSLPSDVAAEVWCTGEGSRSLWAGRHFLAKPYHPDEGLFEGNDKVSTRIGEEWRVSKPPRRSQLPSPGMLW